MTLLEKQNQVHGNIFKPVADTEVLIPFGPVIAYKKLSEEFVKNLNSHIDDDLEDHSDYLVGKVKQELRFTEKINRIFTNELGGFVFEYYKFCYFKKNVKKIIKTIILHMDIFNLVMVHQIG